MLSAGIDVSEMRHLMVDLVEQFRLKNHPEFSGDGRKMNGGIGRTSDRAVNDHCIFKRFPGENVADTDSPFPPET